GPGEAIAAAGAAEPARSEPFGRDHVGRGEGAGRGEGGAVRGEVGGRVEGGRTNGDDAGEPNAGEATHDALTPRELELLRYMAEGYTNKEVARAMVLAEDTVKKAVQTLIAKLGAADRTN